MSDMNSGDSCCTCTPWAVVVRIAKPPSNLPLSSRAITEEVEKIEPTPNDVLRGRGKKISNHPGNRKFSNIIKGTRQQYVFARKDKKRLYSKRVLDVIQQMDPPGRFLSAGKEVDEWIEDICKEALAKIRQALRGGASDLLLKKSGVASPSSKDHQQIEGEGARPKDGETEQHIIMVSLQTRNHKGHLD